MQIETQRRPAKWMTWLGYVISALPVMLLLLSAYLKLNPPTPPSDPIEAKKFADQQEAIGWKQEYMPTLCVVELACTILYVVPPTSVLGAVLLTGYLGGATATHARTGDPMFVMPFILGVLVWLGLFLRERRLWSLLPWRT